MKIAFQTLGCKLNQFDTAVMKEQAAEAQKEIVPFDQKADVYVINTCSVTGKSNYESRQMVRKAHRRNPEAKIIVTGCYAQTHPQEILKIPGVNLVIGTQEKGNWLDYLGGCDKAAGPLEAVNTDFETAKLDQPLIRRFGERTRAIVKVQDGCDARCSFCLIPRARGPSRSVPESRVIEQIQWLEAGGYQETVLTGINLGLYGREFKPKSSLSKLVRRILSETSMPRIRLSSVEPKTVTLELLKTVSSSSRICRHFHIPLQSGNDRILKAMNRHYSTAYYRKLIRRIYEAIPGVCIGTDVMVGFPGEGESEFESTVRLLEDIPISYFHVFPYSTRPQTPAAEMSAQLPRELKAKRSLRLIDLSHLKQTTFTSTFMGQKHAILTEWERDRVTGLLKGYSDNYIRVHFSGPDSLKGRIIPTILHDVIEGVAMGCATEWPVLAST